MRELWRCELCEWVNQPDVQICARCGEPHWERAPAAASTKSRSKPRAARVRRSGLTGFISKHLATEGISAPIEPPTLLSQRRREKGGNSLWHFTGPKGRRATLVHLARWDDEWKWLTWLWIDDEFAGATYKRSVRNAISKIEEFFDGRGPT